MFVNILLSQGFRTAAAPISQGSDYSMTWAGTLTTICIWGFDGSSSRRIRGGNSDGEKTVACRWVSLFMAVAFALAGGPVTAQEIVHFPSLDAGRTMLEGYLFRPEAPGPHPAIVGLHGCSGMFLPNGTILPIEFAWAYLFQQQGYAVLLVDSFGPRQHGEMCSITGFNLSIYYDRPKDAYGALAYLQAQDYVRPDRIAAVGWSQGGGVVLLSIGNHSLGRPPGLPPERDFRAAVAFYPASCGNRLEPDDWSTNIPLLVLQGEADVWTPAPRCEEFIAAAAARGATVSMQLYPGAYHAFDAPNVAKRELPKYVTRAGVVPIIATDPAARADAFQRVPEFFARYLTE